MKPPTALMALVAKELRQTGRDRRMMALLVVAPVVQLTILGFAVELDVSHVPAVVADEDRTAASRRLADGLVAGDTFDVAGRVPTAKDAEELIARGEAPIAFVVPRGFARDLAHRRGATVQVLVDGGDSNRAIVAQNALGSYVMREAVRTAEARLQELAAASGAAIRLPRTTVEPRVLYNPRLASKVFFVPGVAAVLLMVVTLIVTAMGLAREKELGTLEQVMVTPIRPATLIAGKTLPYGIIGLVDLGLVIVAGALVFDVPIRGSLLVAFTGGALYIVCMLGLGLLLSNVTRTQQQAFMGAFFFLMPAMLLSGFITPIANMPELLQHMTLLNPVRHIVEVLRGVLLKGAGFRDLAPQLVALAALGGTIFSFAALGLRRRLD